MTIERKLHTARPHPGMPVHHWLVARRAPASVSHERVTPGGPSRARGTPGTVVRSVPSRAHTPSQGSVSLARIVHPGFCKRPIDPTLRPGTIRDPAHDPSIDPHPQALQHVTSVSAGLAFGFVGARLELAQVD